MLEVDGVVAESEKRRGGCSAKTDSLIVGTEVDWSGEASGDAAVEDGLEEVAVDAVDDEKGVVTSIGAATGALSARPTLAIVSERGSIFTRTSSTFTAATDSGGADLSLIFHSFALLCCTGGCGCGCDCTGSAVWRGDGARPKLNGRCVGERKGGGVDEGVDDDVGDDCREP